MGLFHINSTHKDTTRIYRVSSCYKNTIGINGHSSGFMWKLCVQDLPQRAATCIVMLGSWKEMLAARYSPIEYLGQGGNTGN